MKTALPRPADFDAVFAQLGTMGAARHYGRDKVTIRKWKENKPQPDRRAPPPADLAENAPQMYKHQLMTHYKVGLNTLNRWLDALGLETKAPPLPPPPVKKPPIPDDFTAIAAGMTIKGLARRYKVSESAVRRWLRDTCIDPVKYIPAPPIKRHNPLGHYLVSRDLRNWDRFDEAADILRRERFIVYRCGKNGIFHAKGIYWRCGMSVLTDEELLTKANRYRKESA